MTGETKAYVRPSASGNPVTRAFCPECGAPVFSKNPAMPGMLFLRASSLDDLEVFKPQMHVWAGRAASWDAPSAGLPASIRCLLGCEVSRRSRDRDGLHCHAVDHGRPADGLGLTPGVSGTQSRRSSQCADLRASAVQVRSALTLLTARRGVPEPARLQATKISKSPAAGNGRNQ